MRTLAYITCLLLVGVVCATGQDQMELGTSKLRIEGLATGGSLSIGYVAGPNRLLTVQTAAGDGPAQISQKLVDASQAPNSNFKSSIQLGEDGTSVRVPAALPGEVFVRTTDSGINTVANVANLTAIFSQLQNKVTLTWTLPANAPDIIFILRKGEPLAALSGTETTYTDDGTATLLGNIDKPGGIYALLCGRKVGPDNSIESFSDVVTVQSENPKLLKNDVFAITTTQSFIARAVKAQAYKQIVRNNAGTNPVTWSVDGGTLPPGLVFNAVGLEGQISGIPTTSGNFTFTVKVTDANGVWDTKSFSIVVTDLPLLGE